MTNIYFDFEFIDDGREIVPISLGMCVGQDTEDEIQAEISRANVTLPSRYHLRQTRSADLYIEYQFDPARANDWVRENVFPHLQTGGVVLGDHGSTRAGAARYIRDWVESACGDTKPKFWGYFPSYDFVLLCQHFGTMMQTPKGWPMRPECLMQMADERGVPKGEFPKQEKEHHALADAKWNRDLHHMLMERPGIGRRVTMSQNDFRSKLKDLINCQSLEGGSYTPDVILAQYLNDCLDAFDRAVAARATWWGQRISEGVTSNEPE